MTYDGYQGGRFYKSDLHMHTPLDRHWRDDSTRIRITDSEDRKIEVAKLYLKQCHEVGLEVVGVTDHNFAISPDHSFVKYLRQENGNVASELGRAPLIIFPGFEIEADVGTGHHVVCLFPPETDLQTIDSRLTTCGLPPDARFETNGAPKQASKRLNDIIEAVQLTQNHTGLVICPHPFEAKGLLCDGNAEMWLQKEEFRNPDLLCIEVPKPVDELPKGLGKLIVGGEDCEQEWRREIPIACIRSSDCYRFKSEDGNPGNFIGYRYCWIRMSEPSIEALRQACLDHESRIRLCKDRPEDSYEHPTIVQVQVTGGLFYQADPIYLSPNLNCIIGGRGSGKSTLIDYIRLALDQLRENEIPEKLRKDIRDRLKDTLTDQSKIIVDFKKSRILYRVEYTHSNNENEERKILRLDTKETNPEWSVRTLFPIRILSQGEIDKSIDPTDRNALMKLLDDFIAPELESLYQNERELIGVIKSLDLSIANKSEGQQRRSTLVTQKTELEGRLTRLENVRIPLERWTIIEGQDRYLQALFKECEQLSKIVHEHIENLQIKQSYKSDLEEIPNKELLDRAKEIVDNAAASLRNKIEENILSFENASGGKTGMLRKLLEEEWAPIYSTEKDEYQVLRQQLEERGDNPGAYLSLRSQLEDVKSAISQIELDYQKIIEMGNERGRKITDLRKTWQEQTKIRKNKADELMERLRPLRSGNKPLVEIEITHQGNVKNMIDIWSNKLKDRRQLNETDIRSFIETIAKQSVQEKPLPEQCIASVRNSKMKPIIEKVLGNRAQNFFKVFDDKTLREIEIERVADEIIYRVNRQDGSLAGPIEKVSAGQKGLAFLNLLLASGKVPLIVDTPEEGLDNEGVYTELVPIFRKEKETRQIIVVTHNANIPVNGDAELIVSLEAFGTIDIHGVEEVIKKIEGTSANLDLMNLKTLIEDKDWTKKVADHLKSNKWTDEAISELIRYILTSREVKGKIRRLQKQKTDRMEECVGALDKFVVKRAVQDIMEGSEYAFKKRGEKYGF